RERVRAYLPKSAGRRRVELEIALELLAVTEPVHPSLRLRSGQALGSGRTAINAYTIREVTPEDWGESWKVHFPLQRVGKRLVIKPSWVAYEAVEGDVVLRLDPGMGFGTGHHATTRLCLEMLEEEIGSRVKGQGSGRGNGIRVLDAGTGSGILTLAALKLDAAAAVALDIDVDAVREARANLRREGLAKRARVVRGSLPCKAVEAGTFDVAVMNIHVRACHELMDELVAALRPGGVAIMSGFREEERDGVVARARAAGLAVGEVREAEGWVAMRGRKASGQTLRFARGQA
ncbi:MAG: 50S ribosomal protein L11 methyltransferase, partial [Chloroflexi bacterium]|nr:50S ribosomal protein L11 methyltransferase [Chloroflexota bacterium]